MLFLILFINRYAVSNVFVHVTHSLSQIKLKSEVNTLVLKSCLEDAITRKGVLSSIIPPGNDDTEYIIYIPRGDQVDQQINWSKLPLANTTLECAVAASAKG